MICTCTMNPSLDYYLEFDENIKNGKLNRSNLEYYEAWRDTVSEIQKFISGLNIPLRRYPDYTGKYKLYHNKCKSYVLNPNRLA